MREHRFNEYTDFIIDKLEMSPSSQPCWQGAGESFETCYGLARKFHRDMDWPPSREAAYDRFYTHYWLPSGAQDLPWPLDLVHYDCSVNQGGGVAENILAEMGDHIWSHEEYLLKRLIAYQKLWNTNEEVAAINWEGWLERLSKIGDYIRGRGGISEVKRFYICDDVSCVQMPYYKASIVGDKLYVRMVQKDEEISRVEVDEETT